MEIIFKTKPNKDFTRQGQHLVAIKHITLLEALEAKSFDLINLDGSEVSVVVSDILNPSTLLKVEGQGFYYQRKPEFGEEESQCRLERGDLYVRFNIIFPTELTPAQKDTLREVLEE